MNRNQIPIVYVLLVVLLLCACQPTPEQEIVVNRTDESLEAILQQPLTNESVVESVLAYEEEHDLKDFEEATDNEMTVDDLYHRIHISETYAIPANQADITVDTNVLIPIAEQWPIYSVTKKYFTTEKMLEICRLYSPNLVAFEGNYTPSKQDFANMIDRANESEAVADINRGYQASGLSSTVQSELEAAMQTAPMDFNYKQLSYEELETSIKKGYPYFLRSDDGNAFYTVLLFSRWRVVATSVMHSIQDENIVSFGARVGEAEGRKLNNPSLTLEEACKKGDAILQALEIDDMILSETETMKAQRTDAYLANVQSEGWLLTYRKNIDGIPCITPANPERIESEQYAEAWVQNKLTLYLDADGLWYMDYQGPCDINEKMSENVPLLPFEEILQACVNRIKIEQATESIQHVRINDIVLGYCIIPNEMNGKEGYTLPCWIVDYEVDSTLATVPFHYGFVINAVTGANVHIPLALN